jgi:membrane-bound inhibitor of C-type lysozyme
MGNLFSLDLFLEVKTNGETSRYHCSPATETQIHQINSRKSELIASSPATQIASFRNVISTEAFLVRQQPALT